MAIQMNLFISSLASLLTFGPVEVVVRVFLKAAIHFGWQQYTSNDGSADLLPFSYDEIDSPATPIGQAQCYESTR
jgi:hypothetical protein